MALCILSHFVVVWVPRPRFPVLHGIWKWSKGYNLEHEDSSSVLSTLLRLEMEWPRGSRLTGAFLFFCLTFC